MMRSLEKRRLPRISTSLERIFLLPVMGGKRFDVDLDSELGFELELESAEPSFFLSSDLGSSS